MCNSSFYGFFGAENSFMTSLTLLEVEVTC